MVFRSAVVFLVLSASPGAAFAAPPAVALRLVASGLDSPTEIVNAGDSSGRLFVVEKTGRIRVLRGSNLLPAPFLDLSSQLSSSGERGALGLAFHPQFAANRRFFVFYARTDGTLRIASFTVSSSNPDTADAASERVVLEIPHPVFDNHNGGRLAFGPDGYLYVGVGDGGSGGDPSNNAQSLATLLGKILRLDVDAGGAAGYAIPSDNPFVSRPGARAEIWAYGLRNPWRFTFDRATRDLYIGDVGQGAVEEIDFVPAGSGSGLNFGWRVLEGSHCFNPSTLCSLDGATGPVLEYLHDAAGGQSITGGYVYRGTHSAALRGWYFFGDFVSNRMWAAIREGVERRWTRYPLDVSVPLAGISSFGEDEAGELYVASYADGRLYAIDGPAPAWNPASRFEPGVARCCHLWDDDR
jgi:glucose/arabinose dehydrogenase